jgi:hypothetical protein
MKTENEAAREKMKENLKLKREGFKTELKAKRDEFKTERVKLRAEKITALKEKIGSNIIARLSERSAKIKAFDDRLTEILANRKANGRDTASAESAKTDAYNKLLVADESLSALKTSVDEALGDAEGVTVSLRTYIEKCQIVFCFRDFVAGDLAVYDFCEDGSHGYT